MSVLLRPKNGGLAQFFVFFSFMSINSRLETQRGESQRRAKIRDKADLVASSQRLRIASVNFAHLRAENIKRWL